MSYETIRIESDGKPIKGVRAISFNIDAAQRSHGAQVVFNTCNLSVQLQRPQLAMIHPVEGDVRVIQRVQFADGTSWEAQP